VNVGRSYGNNVALLRDARAISVDAPASLAVDGDVNTTACTLSAEQPWWSVDLGQPYTISSVSVTVPSHAHQRLYLHAHLCASSSPSSHSSTFFIL